MQPDSKNLICDSIIFPMTELSEQIRELEEKFEKTTHHNFVAVLKEVRKFLCDWCRILNIVLSIFRSHVDQLHTFHRK